MPDRETTLEYFTRQGASRRSFLKFCALTASSLALPTSAAKVIAQVLATTPRPRIIWLSSQECTGCSEALLRSFDPPLENLLLTDISLDYHNTLMAPSGTAAEDARLAAIAAGGHVVVIDGSVSLMDNGAWSIIAGRTALDVIQESVSTAALIIAVGTCAAFGGIPGANPNPTDAHGIDVDLPGNQGIIQLGRLVTNAPVINVPGCPPVPEVISGVIVYYLTYGLPPVDSLNRPTAYFGTTVHRNCVRLPHYRAKNFAESFDDEGARAGFCLLHLGCKGPRTHNSCTTQKWNGGTSYPMDSGHGCLGCAEPNFWDKAGGFYAPLSAAELAELKAEGFPDI
jgi:hydrogenase small subunit